MHQKFAYTYKL